MTPWQDPWSPDAWVRRRVLAVKVLLIAVLLLGSSLAGLISGMY